MRWTLAALAVVTVTVAACGGSSTPVPSVAGGGDDVPLCEDVPAVEPPAEHLRDEPIYVGNEQPTEELSAWASSQPGFEQLWIDRDRLGWVVLAFSTDAEARQDELRDRFPDVGAVVVGVDWTSEELTALQSRVADAELGYATWTSVDQGVVGIDVGPLTEERVAAVAERFAGERVCVSGVDPAELPSEGPQAQAGDGWRLLADETTGEPYRTGIAADPSGYAQLWEEIGLSGEPSPVDFDTEVAIWFGAVYSGSCPEIRLDGVAVDHERALVYADIVQTGEVFVCTDDANPRAYLVAVERSALPPGPFAVQLGAHDPPPGAPEERTRVDADLRQPGATFSPDQVGPDPELAEPRPNVAGPGDIVETGYPAAFRFWLHCGPEWLGPLNDVVWRSDVTDTPTAWREAMDGSQELVVEVLIETDPATLTATANGHDVVYHPTAEPHPGCD